MEPPPYTEHGYVQPYPARLVDWDELLPYITPETITPEMYHSLLSVAKHFIWEFAEANTVATIRKAEFDYSLYARNLRWSRIIWKIVHTFSESHPSLIFIRWLEDYLVHADLDMFITYESYSCFRGKEFDVEVGFNRVIQFLKDIGLLTEWTRRSTLAGCYVLNRLMKVFRLDVCLNHFRILMYIIQFWEFIWYLWKLKCKNLFLINFHTRHNFSLHNLNLSRDMQTWSKTDQTRDGPDLKLSWKSLSRSISDLKL